MTQEHQMEELHGARAEGRDEELPRAALSPNLRAFPNPGAP